VEYPSDQESILFFYCSDPCNIVQIRYLAYGTPGSAVTFSVRYGMDIADPGTELLEGGILAENSTTGGSATELDHSVIPAGNWVWLTTSALQGEIQLLHLSMVLH
jgi:hypothetical protein